MPADSAPGSWHLSKSDEPDGHLLEHALGLEEEDNPLNIQQGSIALRDGDSLLVCSDGLYDRLVDQRLADIVCSNCFKSLNVFTTLFKRRYRHTAATISPLSWYMWLRTQLPLNGRLTCSI